MQLYKPKAGESSYGPALDVGDGLIVRAWWRQEMVYPEGLGVKMVIAARWDHASFSYVVTGFQIELAEDSDETINGVLLRRIPVEKWLSSFSKSFTGYELDGKLTTGGREALRLGALGPTPETLRWVARMHNLAVVTLVPPTQEIAKKFNIPHRTASHWIKLARERGHLTESRYQTPRKMVESTSETRLGFNSVDPDRRDAENWRYDWDVSDEAFEAFELMMWADVDG